MKIAVLAVQGAFIEHEKALQRLGAETVELRKAEDLEQDFDGLVLPGGESTVQSRLLKELSMFEPLKEKIEEGLPVLATCAGLILLAQNVSNDEKRGFATLPVTVKRLTYGCDWALPHNPELQHPDDGNSVHLSFPQQSYQFQ